ncbi:MAG: alkaline phosphatase family protein [Acidimicrobiales bacterium]
MRRVNRRQFLGGAGAMAAAAAMGAHQEPAPAGARLLPLQGSSNQMAALAVLGRTALRYPDSLPFPNLAPGTDTMPQIEHIVVLMLENHSYDNLFGMLTRGDGFALGSDGLPTATNPYGDGRVQHAFRMPGTCQLPSRPSNEWTASHNAYDNGKLDGFVSTPISFGNSDTVGGVAMGYWTSADLPFTYSLAGAFPVGDRWFCSMLGQTDPNRRYLIAATSAGMTEDISLSPSGVGVPMVEQDALLATPANGTIFDRLSAFGISWVDYTASYPTGTTAELFPLDDGVITALNEKAVATFFTDCAAGSLPGFSLIDPDFSTQSQENPQDLAVGEAFLATVVKAIGASPNWPKTLLVVTYDEHGGYYDHVGPPVALAPDALPPVVQPGQSAYDGFCRYGFRVPAVVVSPYAVPAGVTHVVHDHTSILAMVERKWNLPAMTFRDANANDLTDFLAMDALQSGNPTFPELPTLAEPGSSTNCPLSPSMIPPAGSITS